jgi:hypothetical protein
VAQQQEQPSKVERWAYPFPLKNPGARPAPEDYLSALSASEDGFYPIGANGLWHGGIHFGTGTAGKFEQDHGVRCIADGEVVAYRLNAKLQELAYPEGIKAGYSSGFTLVRHRLVLPKPATPSTQPANTANGAPAQNTSTPAEDVLTFFSLYMHTLPLDGYGASKALPSYYGATDIYTVGTKANDFRKNAAGQEDHSQPGLRVRASHAAGSAALGWLSRGTQIGVGQKHGSWGKITSFVSGAVQSYQEGAALPANAATGWVFLGELDKQSQPSAVDQVYVLPKPHKVAAGETVAYIGEYQRLVEARAHHGLPPKLGARPLLHVEVFTGDDINAFISRSRVRAPQLDPKSRNLLLISKGAKLVQPSSPNSSIPHGTSVKDAPGSPDSGAWRKVLQVNASGTPISNEALWIARESPHGNDARPAWSEFPLSLQSAGGAAAAWTRVVSTASAQCCADAESRTWYAVSIADENNAQIDGWVCDHGHPLVELKSPWDWPGFDVTNLQTSVSDMFERALFIADSGTPDEIALFEDSFNSARSDETIRKLEDAIDALEQRDGKITAHELQMALGKPWLADRIDHLIVRYESEWGGEMGKWDALDSHMHAGLPVWQAEKTRIGALRYWASISGVTGWPTSANVYHMHPAGVVGNFFDPDACACGCCVDVTGTRFKVDANTYWYGPQHSGSIQLGACPALATMRANGTLSEIEERILRAMSQNEGKVDTVQAIDKAIISAGAMQKTIRGAESRGELATQIAAFRDAHPADYQRYFSNCGWTVTGSAGDASLGYADSTFTNGVRITGDELYTALRRDCSIDTFGKPVKCPPVASMAHAVSSPLYQELQVKDFVDRLNHAIGKRPSGYDYQIKDYLQSPLGRATVLDQDVNAPGATANSMKSSLDHFFQHNPHVPRNPAEWGANRAAYETSILQDYGPSRYMAQVNGVSVAPQRYSHLAQILGMPS